MNIVSPLDPNVIVSVSAESLPVWSALGWTATSAPSTAHDLTPDQVQVARAVIRKTAKIIAPYDSTVVSTIQAESLPVWLSRGWTQA